MNRRNFLRGSAMVALFLGGMGMPSHPDTEQIRAERRRKERWTEAEQIIWLASFAPSTHNTQPWQVTLMEPRHWLISIDPVRCLPAVDPGNREAFLSMGAFLESLHRAAAVHGYEAEIKVIARSTRDQDVAEVILHPGRKTDLFVEKEILMRRTLRKNHLKREFSREDWMYLLESDAEKIRYYPLQSREGRYISEQTLAANERQVLDEAVQRELSEWVRWTKADIRRCRDGLTPATMELGRAASFYVEHFYSAEDVLGKDFRDKTVEQVKSCVEEGSGWLLISSPSDTVTDLMTSGRVLQRMWLRCRERKIAIHPMSQLLEESSEHTAFLCGDQSCGKVQFLLRAGYVENYPDPVSPRRSVDALIKYQT